MGNESASSTQELGPQFASALYDRLQSLRGKACMSGYGHGEVIYPDIARRIGIAKLSTDADYERELFTERGFTDEDLQSGVTAVMESEFLNHNWPRSSYIQEPRLRYYNISGTGRVIGGRHNELEPTTLEPHHLDAIQTVASLSVIPQQIIEHFGTYEDFLAALGRKDMAGIDVTEFTPMEILYNGGLREFVRALGLRTQRELDRLDTAHHALKDSLDKRDHFTKLEETIRKMTG